MQWGTLMSILSYNQPSMMTVKAGDPIPLLHKEAEEDSQPTTRLVEKKKKTLFDIVKLSNKSKSVLNLC